MSIGLRCHAEATIAGVVDHGDRVGGVGDVDHSSSGLGDSGIPGASGGIEAAVAGQVYRPGDRGSQVRHGLGAIHAPRRQ